MESEGCRGGGGDSGRGVCQHLRR